MRFVVALGFAALATSASAKPNETETTKKEDVKPGVLPLDPISKAKLEPTSKTDAKAPTAKTDAKSKTDATKSNATKSKTESKNATTSKTESKTEATKSKTESKTDATKSKRETESKTDATKSTESKTESTKSKTVDATKSKTADATKSKTESKDDARVTSVTTDAKKTDAKSPATKSGAKTTAKRSSSKKRVAKKQSTKKYDQSHVVAINEATKTAAYRYGQLDDHDCFAELDARKIPYTRESATRGIRSPMRLSGPLHGVTFKTELPEKQRATTIWEIGDCRLVLAMDDFASILATHDVVEVKHYSMYRLPPKSDGDKQGTRHPGGLALDAAKFITKTGTTLVVDKDFGGKIDAPTCGADAKPNPSTAEAIELRKILCETVDQHLFNVVLTPNYNKPHHNHFHLEVTAGVKWFLVH